MNFKKTLAVLCAGLVLTLAVGTQSMAGDYKLTLKLSHVFSPAEQLSKSMDAVAESIHERTDGAINIQTFPQAQLPAYKEGVEQVVRGAKFISVEDPSFIGDYVPDFKALYAPMLYRSFDEYVKLTQTELVADMKAKAEAQGIKILALDYIYGFRNLITQKVIKTPADLEGMKIRTPGSKSYIDTLNAMGAVATPLPWGETLSAVQQGVVDGLEGSEFTNIGTKVYEGPTKNVANTRHILGTCGVYISTKVWNDIPAEYRAIIEEEFTKGANHMVELLKSQHGGVVKELESYGVKFNEVDGDAFRAALAPLYEEQEGMTPGIFKSIFSELDAMR
ncbi:TRAP dicarboxylate transporter-DctP subunit [Pseudodesulfovibrio profundus]|uniref:TRAP dicarboxylate transporter-DctP subunit n=1 Tax=Pseudodesulfovibrio profundus TaxID=57320 RepID=A0A2C8FDQ3_9BACT|nr:C4-dicarboxylate TRAP transporter substrate-binding protein [Pseudodesulfovibrio profundus]MBC16842.1 C4-dicarboxylate ABC transporter substrate-binding protein [Desulfovibrio sp.]SOB60293.1 TRAP dicarboxylate transporter-DctP subunit [Pseudodesulfovibrio profundus]|tara:strand:- start:6649 stop:7650 length:1002 start_codon:yes stop_codon:yes gene_type:complete